MVAVGLSATVGGNPFGMVDEVFAVSGWNQDLGLGHRP